jgi:hypothetical protein
MAIIKITQTNRDATHALETIKGTAALLIPGAAQEDLPINMCETLDPIRRVRYGTIPQDRPSIMAR